MGRISVNEERCKGCGYCLAACKSENIYLDPNRRNRNGYSIAAFSTDSSCSGCALCAEVCPDVALEVFR